MPMSQNLGAYADCEEYWERALNSANGIAVAVDSPGQAKRLVQRLNTYRKIMRERTHEVYPIGDTRRGKSAYDNLRAMVNTDSPNKVNIQPFVPPQVEEL